MRKAFSWPTMVRGQAEYFIWWTGNMLSISVFTDFMTSNI